jgi:Na+-transporting methylmalonyl-CoA/oxaloacetate decarboxylase gamma subunit
MKRIIENLAVMMLVLLFLVIIVLVVRYNMIEEASSNMIQIPETVTVEEMKKVEKKDYLNSLESYGEDVDVKVDPTKETHKNTVKIISELTEDELEDALKTDEKKNYLKSLESYSNTKKRHVKTENLEDVKPEKVQNNDTIGDELDSILGE